MLSVTRCIFVVVVDKVLHGCWHDCTQEANWQHSWWNSCNVTDAHRLQLDGKTREHGSWLQV